MSIVRDTGGNKGKTTGTYPRAGSSRAASLAKTAMAHIARSRQMKALARSVPSTIPSSHTRMMPATTKISGPTFRTSSGKKVQMPGSTLTHKAKGPRDFHGFQEFPAFGLLPYISAGSQMRLSTRMDRFGKKAQLVNIKAIRAPLNRLLAITGIPFIGARFVVWHVGRWALMEIVWKTPYDTGEAAAGWTISPQLRGKGRGYGHVGFRISTSVPYVIFLEHGHSDKAPQGMVRTTMLQARTELRNLMDELIAFWKEKQFALRGFTYDEEQKAGVPFDPQKMERKLPSMAWRELMSRLEIRLPLDKPVAHLNAMAYMALRTDDPKDWHTVGDLPERNAIFESRVRRISVNYVGHTFERSGVMSRVIEEVEHVRMGPSEGVKQQGKSLAQDMLERQARDLQKTWGSFSKQEREHE